MSMQLVVSIIIVAIVAVIGMAAFIFLSASKAQKAQMQSMSGRPAGPVKSSEDVERIKKMTAHSKVVQKKEDIAVLLMKAGKYRQKDRVEYERYKIMCLIGVPILVSLLMGLLFNFAVVWMVAGGGLGAVVGATLPRSKIDKQIRLRQEEIMYYLPLVVEQISIGSSSGLDPGTCITHVLKMADMRGSHNAVTDMFVHVIRLVRTGMNLENALKEVGEISYMNELKHTFLFLAQSIKHGGEVAKQLQDLADSVASTKQTQVEEKITALPVKATFPLFLVFAGFFLMLVIAVFMMLMEAMKS